MAGRVGKRVYAGRQWKVVRRAIFDRDNWRCRICGKAGVLNCDHIRPIAKGGDWYDPTNLRTLCRGCHIKITALERRGDRAAPSFARAQLMQMAIEAANVEI